MKLQPSLTLAAILLAVSIISAYVCGATFGGLEAAGLSHGMMGVLFMGGMLAGFASLAGFVLGIVTVAGVIMEWIEE